MSVSPVASIRTSASQPSRAEIERWRYKARPNPVEGSSSQIMGKSREDATQSIWKDNKQLRLKAAPNAPGPGHLHSQGGKEKVSDDVMVQMADHLEELLLERSRYDAGKEGQNLTDRQFFLVLRGLDAEIGELRRNMHQ